MPKKATRYERRKAGEVKRRKTPITAPELSRLVERGVREVDNIGGFTGPAIALARKRGIKLFSQRKRIR